MLEKVENPCTKAMVHYICMCDIKLWHFVLVKLARNFLVDCGRRQVGYPWCTKLSLVCFDRPAFNYIFTVLHIHAV